MTEAAEKNDLAFLCDASEPVEGEGFRVELPNFPALAVFKYDDKFFVIDDKCSHGNASLCDGDVDGCEVECPFHAGAFNFMTGEPTAAPCTVPVRTYEARVVEGKLYMVI
ncbi:non-heme iron oxygenase ferredoxin subunit [Marinobacter zhejiangensis]|uniref:Ethylbenzene dioxygenase ferredoxin subunit n=1 Tax=Marinobacter zhejiangensis TaxID=488535 RepID=A0A1I4PHG8_9GAMM|nr:non-heme iron oxygenase ferredoxin subunit [Marinobacter zhejiangensis]SFM26985.1 ethylbenzene dioxygenase ferredoxin subunit [Marinobacter zhejiangensis]